MPNQEGDRVAQLEAAYVAAVDAVRAKTNERDKAAAKFKTELRKLTDKADAAAAELSAVRKVDGLSDAEKAAISAELAKVGG